MSHAFAGGQNPRKVAETAGSATPLPVSVSMSAAAVRGTPSQERFEIKYWVPERLTATVATFANSYLKVDPYQALNGQRVSSLYLDTPAHHFYQDHVDESPDRAKLRIRVYGETLGAHAFFELKRKVKSVIVKRRAK